MRLSRTGHQADSPPRTASVPRRAGILSGRSLATACKDMRYCRLYRGKRQGYWETGNRGNCRPILSVRSANRKLGRYVIRGTRLDLAKDISGFATRTSKIHVDQMRT